MSGNLPKKKHETTLICIAEIILIYYEFYIDIDGILPGPSGDGHPPRFQGF
jgi:hypothetical protein